MDLRPAPKISSSEGLQYMALTAAVYGVLMLVGDYALEILPGLQIRFAAFIPVVAGMLLGCIGACGAFCGCFLVELWQTGSWQAALGFAILSFFWAYLPYKLWFGIRSSNATLYIYNKATFAKFILIVAVIAFNYAATSVALIDLLYPNSVASVDKLFLHFSNNFDFTVLLGIPLLFYIRNNSSTVFYEKAAAKPTGGYQVQVLAIVTLLSIGSVSLELLEIAQPLFTCLFLICAMLGFAYVATIPSHYLVSDLEKSNFRSVSAELTISLINLATITIIVIVISSVIYSYQGLQSLQDLEQWRKFYGKLFLVLNLGLVCIFLLLRYIEVFIIGKLEGLAEGLRNYVHTGEIEQTSKELEQLAGRVHRNELEVLEGCLARLKLDINQYLLSLTKTLQDKHKLQSQLDIAENIQKGMLPKLEDVNATLKQAQQPYTLAGGMSAAKTVGGDMYDCLLLDTDHLLVMIADVEGKGLPAALFMVVTQALLNNSANVPNPAMILEKANQTLSKENRNQFFVSMWLGILELSTGKISYVNAGHKPPLVRTNKGVVRRLDTVSGPALGNRNAVYDNLEIVLQSGERLFLYTEGFSDSVNAHQEAFGLDRLEQAVGKAVEPDDVIAAVNAFMDGAEQVHDMTYLWLERV
ncbi:MAG: PP2C family protein-serine/threonine phosphatase [Phascolarctobacterium sp.]